jgi:hypothetical protein
MAVSTKIVHRRDTASNWTTTNPTLASGEIGFETDTLKFKVGNGSTAWTSLKYSQDASLLTGNASITTLTTTGDINTAGKLSVTASSGDEGGEIFLSNAVTNTSITSGVTIDVYKDRLRFFEQGGSARGYYIDITAGGGGASTNLAGGGGGTGTVTSVTASSPLTGGTITTSGSIGINASSTSTANYVVQRDANASFSVNALTATRVNYGTGTGAPTFTSYSAGVREVFYDNISVSQAGYAVGIDAGVLWHGLPGADAGQFFKWYGGVTEVAKLSGTGILTASSFVSNVASGTAPFAVTSNTLVTNLNADLLDGYNTATASTANTVVVRDASQNFAANTITANLFGTANLATNVVGGTANKGEILYQSGVNTTAELTAPTVNNSALLYNTSTNAPYWISPTGSMASLMGYTSTVTAAGFTSLTNASTYYQQFTGTTTQTVVLPNTATLVLGWTFHIVNNSTANVTANTFANAATVLTIPAGTTAMVTCIDITANTAAAWEAGLTDFSTFTGTGSVVMNNTPTFTTPSIGAATGTSLNVTGQLISTNAGAPLAVSNATVVANLASTYATRGAIVGNTVPTVANTSNMARIYVSNTTPTSANAGDIWISF